MKLLLAQLQNTLKRRALKAGLLLGLFVFALALAHSWALHSAVCAEAGKPTHLCAATLLAGGQVNASSGAIAVEAPPLVEVVAALPKFRCFAVGDFFLLPSRGPPLLPT